MNRDANWTLYKFKIKPLTPVIINSGEDLDGYEYIIKSSPVGSKKEVISFNFSKLFNLLPQPDQRKLMDLMEISPLSLAKEINNYSKYIIENPEVHRFSFYATEAFAEHVEKRINNTSMKGVGELSIKLFQRTISRPYIPGSSIKGAIRTAMIYKKKEEKSIRDIGRYLGELRSRDESKWKKWESDICNYTSTYDDPFRQIKISDTSVVQTHAVLERFFTIKDNRVKEGAPTLREAIFPELNNKDQIIFGSLIIDNKMVGKPNSVSEQNRFEVWKIIRSAREFYREVLNFDLNFYKRITNFKINLDWKDELLRVLDLNLKEMVLPLRIGFGGGIHSKTIQPSNPQIKPISRRFVVNNDECFPLGWIIMELEEE